MDLASIMLVKILRQLNLKYFILSLIEERKEKAWNVAKALAFDDKA